MASVRGPGGRADFVCGSANFVLKMSSEPTVVKTVLGVFESPEYLERRNVGFEPMLQPKAKTVQICQICL